MKNGKFSTGLAAFLMLALAAPAPAADPGWYYRYKGTFGLGLGGGTTTPDGDDETVSIILSAHTFADTNAGKLVDFSFADLATINPTTVPVSALKWSLVPVTPPSGIDGLELSEETGQLYGAVKTPGDYEFQVVATHDGQEGRQTYFIRVGALVFEVAQVSAGNGSTCAVTTAGAVKCWGWNNYGQLGNGDTTSTSRPVDVIGLDKGVEFVAAFEGISCAALKAGGAKCWGKGSGGQLGNGIKANSSEPVPVSGLTAKVKKFAAGAHHTCALTDAGALMCWGDNGSGQIGMGATPELLAPTPVTGLETGVLDVAADSMHTCVVQAPGVVKCMGYNGYGQFGIGTKGGTHRSPIQSDNITSGATQVTGSAYHTCALVSGSVWCWGANESWYRLGTGNTAEFLRPYNIGLSGVRTVSAGYFHTCALLASGGIQCWGGNNQYQLGTNSISTSPYPRWVDNMGSAVASFASGAAHSCAVMTDMKLKCWGGGGLGQLGNGAWANSFMTVDALPE